MENLLIVIAPVNSPLAQQKKFTACHLKGERFIVREKGSGTRMATDRHFQELRFRPQIRMELGSNEAIKEAVAAGLGLGIVSMHALQPDAHASEVVVLDVREFPIQSQWHIVHLEQKKLSPIAALFKDELLKSALC
jgi:DNA-binding transcriptional LysR family regulator